MKSALILGGVYVLVQMLTIPYASIGRLAKENPSETAFMAQWREQRVEQGKPGRIRHHWVPLAAIPRHVQDAVIVAEDGAFFSHEGIDWHEVWESIKVNVENWELARGASTITQQLGKNLYLSPEKTPLRKLKELVITFLLEAQLSKARILEIYLNVIEWGDGVFGIEAAAQIYFNKSARNLTPEEGARLAAVIPNPLRHRPDENSRYVLERKDMLLKRIASRQKGRHE